MSTYQRGHVKRDPSTGAVAMRTRLPDTGQFAAMAWSVLTPDVGPSATTTDEVQSWDDLYTPPN